MPKLTQFREFLADSARQLHRPQALTGAAILAALELVLNQYSIPLSPYLEVGFSFLASTATGFLYGPWVAGMAGFVTDLAGYLLHPTGPYFFGFTLSAILSGILNGLLLYRCRVTLGRAVVLRIVKVLLFNFLLTPLWLSMMYGKAFVVLSGLRLAKNLIKFPVDLALEYGVLRLADRCIRQPAQHSARRW